MSSIQAAVDAVIHSYGHETAHLEPSEQVEAASRIIRELATTMSQLYMDGAINAKREASAELEEERRDHANYRHNRSENLRTISRLEEELRKLRDEQRARCRHCGGTIPCAC